MVTTNSTAVEEVRDLFRRALGLAKDLVGDLDAADDQLRQRAVELFILTIHAVVPVLKYVDKNITGGELADLRGVHLARGLVLRRDGRLLRKDSSEPTPPIRFLFFGSTDEVVDEVLEHLVELAQIFNEALRKMDQRRMSIEDRSRQLNEAIAPFRRDSSS